VPVSSAGARQAVVAAIQAGDRALLARLLRDDPALAGLPTPDGLSPLRLALYRHQPALVEDLLAVLPPVALSVHDAAAAGVVDRLAALLQAEPGVANALAADGFPPLALAAYFGQRAAVELLLAYGATVTTAAANGSRVTALHAALAGPEPEIARLLVAAGADVNARQQGGYTPLHSVAANGRLALAELLVAAGAEPGATNDAGQTPSDLARQAGHVDVAEALLSGS